MRFRVWGLPILMAMGCQFAAAQSAGMPQQPATVPSHTIASAGEDLQFEVATIKPSDPAACCSRTWSRYGRRLSTNNTNLMWLMQWAYGLQAKQIVGGPAWINEDRFDVSGELEGAKIPTDPQWRAALQRLLADRFQLQFHHESREMSAYVLTAARGGAKLTKSDPEKDREPSVAFGGAVGETMHGYGRELTLGQFIAEVQRLALDRPVVDRTGITGTYNLEIAFTREDPAAIGMMQLPDSAAPNLFTALEQQLGLKLEGARAPVDVLVIDRAERPSAN